jgi:Reverse transcriptase (RNA-dependent DNA polymerase)
MNIQEAVNLPGEEGEAWEWAHQAEWKNMVDHDVFSAPAKPPPNMQVLNMGTALRLTHHDGKITKRKVQIVAKGYSHVPGLHYNETYAPVMWWETFHIILAIGAIQELKIWHSDVKSAYLHRVIQEQVWVEQPEGFKVPGKEHMALKLKKVLYGMKQGGNQWRKTFEEFMEKLGWTCSEHDQAVFFRAWDDESWAIMGFWVDDATSVGHEKRLLEREDTFGQRFGVSSQGNAQWILGTALNWDAKSRSIFVSQKNYIEDIAVKYNIQNTKPSKIPIPLGINFSVITNDEDQKDKPKEFLYRELIGNLMFAATVSCSDIAHAVNKLAWYTQTCYGLNNLITEVGRGPRFNIGKVKAEVRVEWGLASAYGLRPPLCAALRFRDKDKRRGSRTRDRVFGI